MLTLTAKNESGQPLPARDSARVKVRPGRHATWAEWVQCACVCECASGRRDHT